MASDAMSCAAMPLTLIPFIRMLLNVLDRFSKVNSFLLFILVHRQAPDSKWLCLRETRTLTYLDVSGIDIGIYSNAI